MLNSIAFGYEYVVQRRCCRPGEAKLELEE